MPMESGHVYRVKFEYTVIGETCLNVQFYEASGVNDIISLTECAGGLATFASTRYSTNLASGANGVQVLIEDVTVPLEFGFSSWVWNGTQAGTIAPPFVSASFRQVRGNKTTRNGYKRISGLSENDIVNGVMASAYLAELETSLIELYVDPIALTFPDDRNVTLTPIIVGRNTDGSLDLTRTQEVVGGILEKNVSTQNTRKFGSGV